MERSNRTLVATHETTGERGQLIGLSVERNLRPKLAALGAAAARGAARGCGGGGGGAGRGAAGALRATTSDATAAAAARAGAARAAAVVARAPVLFTYEAPLARCAVRRDDEG